MVSIANNNDMLTVFTFFFYNSMNFFYKRTGSIYTSKALLGLWLMACSIRALIPWLGNYQTKQFISGSFYISGVESNAVTGAQTASVFAELNKRLEAAQPDTRFFCSPWEESGEYYCQALILKSVRAEAPAMARH